MILTTRYHQDEVNYLDTDAMAHSAERPLSNNNDYSQHRPITQVSNTTFYDHEIVIS